MMASMAAVAGGQGREAEYKVYFGDLHNHNVIGYAQGSLRRSFEIARDHLDFFAFTPHAHWHDIGHYEQSIEDKWINGFAVTRARWGEVLRIRECDAPAAGVRGSFSDAVPRVQTRFRVQDVGEGASADWYSVRVAQANGQLAWSSPIWVNRRT